jgi:glycosyltransferase involved in cell wall biosynthesis
VENSSYKLAMGLANSGHEVTVVTSSRGKRPQKYVEKMGPLTVIRYPEKYFLLEAPLAPRIALAALWKNYDILHVHGMTPPLTDLAIFFAKLRGKPVVLTYHNDAHLTNPSVIGGFVESLYSKFAIPTLAMADKIVSTTQSYAATSQVLRHFLKKVEVIPWGTDAVSRRRSPIPEGSTLIGRDGKKRLLFVGQMKDYKGVNILLEAVARLNQNGHQVAADIVGDGPHLPSLKVTAKHLRRDGNVRFWGEVNDQILSQMYDYCDALVLPSLNRREAFGLVQLDAFAAGKTVVASNIAGVKDVAMMGNGYLARPSDVASLAENISLALKFPVESKHLQSVAEGLTWANTSKKYESLLSETAKNFRRSILAFVAMAALVALQSRSSAAWTYVVHAVSSLFT